MRDSSWFKGRAPENSSDSIVVSFSSHWKSKLRDGRVDLVFRRRIPKTFIARKMYVYIGSPTSCIIGIASIEEINHFSLSAATSYRREACISESELNKYFIGYTHIGAYKISPIVFFSRELPLDYLKREVGFAPPQSFVRVSKEADDWLMQHQMEGASE